MRQRTRGFFLITGDLGFSVFEDFAGRFPGRFINVGVAEANMVGIAAGLASCGKVAFTYSIAPFATIRCLEQIRIDVCYHNANVKIVGVGGGLAYGPLGATHHAIEDISIMRALPNMKVLSPADPVEADLATRAAVAVDGPVYIRLGKSGEPRVHSGQPDFEIGRAITVKDGTNITLVATGGLVYNALLAARELATQGIDARVISMHTIKPLDEEAILRAAHETAAIFTIEEHTLIGGLGSAVAEVLAESGNRKVLFQRIGIRDRFCHEVGSQEYLRELSGLSPQHIVSRVVGYLSRELSKDIM
nr:transketolase C-terminal domain-containing protein [Candidatus Hakubella thermalkaliphila]